MMFRRKPLLFFGWKACRRNPQSCPPVTPSTHIQSLRFSLCFVPSQHCISGFFLLCGV
jgi:hypothetical protein